MISFKLSAIKQTVLNKSKRIKRSIARLSKKRSQQIKDHLPKNVTRVTLKPLPDDEDFSFLAMDILQQMKNTKRTSSRKALHNKKSLKSVIEEARRELRQNPPVTEIRIISIEEDNFEEYVDYENIVVNTFRTEDINSDYIQMS